MIVALLFIILAIAITALLVAVVAVSVASRLEDSARPWVGLHQVRLALSPGAFFASMSGASTGTPQVSSGRRQDLAAETRSTNIRQCTRKWSYYRRAEPQRPLTRSDPASRSLRSVSPARDSTHGAGA